MPRFQLLVLLATLTLSLKSTGCSAEPPVTAKADAIAVADTDWPWWRGPHRNGVASANQDPPLRWSETENVIWKASVPGRGHGSPTIVGERIFLATADELQEIQSVLCYDRKTGTQLWKTNVHHGGFVAKNKRASLASSTAACDGQRVFINFLNGGAVYTTALSLDGQKLWQTKISHYTLHQGYGSSPAVYESLVLVSADNKAGGAVAALDRGTGKIVWKSDRPKTPNYPSPIILNVAGRDQLFFSGCNLVTSFEPLTGQKNWEIKGSTTECVTSMVTDGRLIFTSGGYPDNHMSAVVADGSGEVVWRNNVRVYVPSMLVRDGHLYAVTDAGVATCWKCESGKEVWQGRLGGTFSSSPVLVGQRIYVANEAGETFVFQANPAAFELLADNQLGDDVFATPTICGGRIYMRVAELGKDRRQEILYCLGS